MASAWEDFESPDSRPKEKHTPPIETVTKDLESDTSKGCDWGFTRPDCEPGSPQPSSECSQFITLYEQYLSDKQSLDHRTKNHHLYANNPSKALREWFENEGHDYSHKLEQTCDSQFKCSIDVPVGEQDFTFESEIQPKKQIAIDEVCLTVCKLLDECDLFKSWQQDQGSKDPDRKRRIDEANKEDDIELDNTKLTTTSSHEPKHKKTSLESLKTKWTQLNMSILGLKAKLVKLDLSVSKRPKRGNDDNRDEATGESDDDDEDPLDAFMSNLDKKTELTLDDKIEKSRIKSQICALEREQDEISELINEINS